MERLDVMKIKYARSMYQVLPAVENQNGKVFLKLECEVPNADIRYALGDTPHRKSRKIHPTYSFQQKYYLQSYCFQWKSDQYHYHW